MNNFHVNPVLYSSILQNSATDHIFEFNQTTLYFNIAVPLDWVKESYVLLKLIKKDNISILLINGINDQEFDFVSTLSEYVHFW